MVENFLLHNVWAAVLLWVAVFVADYGLTIRGAALYEAGAKQYMDVGDSYELNPALQKDVDALRPFSWRAALMVVGASGFIVAVWYLPGSDEVFLFVLGWLVLGNLTMVTRHFSAISEMKVVARGDAYSGRLEFPRWFLLHQSGVAMMAHGLLYAILAVLLGSWFLLGGAVGAALAGSGYYLRANRPAARVQQVVMQGGTPPAPADLSAAAAWRRDPTSRHEYRYWDGSSWTADVSDSGNVSSDPL